MNYKELEDKINNITVANCNINDLIEDIKDAKEVGDNFIHYWVTDLEDVEINLNTLEVENISDYIEDDIKKAYAIKESNPKMCLINIMKKMVDKYYLYETLEEYTNGYLEGNCWDDDLTQDQKIEIINSDIENLIDTSWGYLEEV